MGTDASIRMAIPRPHSLKGNKAMRKQYHDDLLRPVFAPKATGRIESDEAQVFRSAV